MLEPVNQITEIWRCWWPFSLLFFLVCSCGVRKTGQYFTKSEKGELKPYGPKLDKFWKKCFSTSFWRQEIMSWTMLMWHCEIVQDVLLTESQLNTAWLYLQCSLESYQGVFFFAPYFFLSLFFFFFLNSRSNKNMFKNKALSREMED